MFMQSQAFFGPDSFIQAQLMEHLDRAAVDVHVACTKVDLEIEARSAFRQVGKIPNIHFRPTSFGPSIHSVARSTQLKRSLGGIIVPGSLLSLAAYMRKQRIQIIHGTEKPRDAFYGVLLGKLTGAKSIIHMHVAYDQWLTRKVKWALGQADAIVAISDFVAQSLIDAGYRRDRIFVVPNALDLRGWHPSVDGSGARAELGLTADAPVIGIVARLFRWKGHAHLVDALALVKKDVPNVRLVIVGEDDQRADPGRGSFRAELEQQLEHLGLQENVIFTGFRTDIPYLMSAFDIFAHPSWEEPFGMVFLEAMAMAKPVVAWASGGAPEVIAHGETGLLAERPSIQSLATALTTLAKDRALRETFGAAGRRRAEQLFSPQRMCELTVDVYRALLSERRATQLRAGLPQTRGSSVRA
jgi:glycosyltransferase involved in cell wall biosynthesis